MLGLTFNEIKNDRESWYNNIADSDKPALNEFINGPDGENMILLKYNHLTLGERHLEIHSSSTSEATLRHSIVFDVTDSR